MFVFKSLEDEKKANEELRQIFEWSNQESDRIIEKMKADGTWPGGLGADPPEVREIHRQRDIKINELARKYGII